MAAAVAILEEGDGLVDIFAIMGKRIKTRSESRNISLRDRPFRQG
jgi:hypothetical protein